MGSAVWSAQRIDRVEVRRLEPGLFSYLSALAAGAPLGEAISAAGLDQDGLVNALGFVFTEGLVCAVSWRRLGHLPCELLRPEERPDIVARAQLAVTLGIKPG